MCLQRFQHRIKAGRGGQGIAQSVHMAPELICRELIQRLVRPARANLPRKLGRIGIIQRAVVIFEIEKHYFAAPRTCEGLDIEVAAAVCASSASICMGSGNGLVRLSPNIAHWPEYVSASTSAA